MATPPWGSTHLQPESCAGVPHQHPWKNQKKQTALGPAGEAAVRDQSDSSSSTLDQHRLPAAAPREGGPSAWPRSPSCGGRAQLRLPESQRASPAATEPVTWPRGSSSKVQSWAGPQALALLAPGPACPSPEGRRSQPGARGLAWKRLGGAASLPWTHSGDWRGVLDRAPSPCSQPLSGHSPGLGPGAANPDSVGPDRKAPMLQVGTLRLGGRGLPLNHPPLFPRPTQNHPAPAHPLLWPKHPPRCLRKWPGGPALTLAAQQPLQGRVAGSGSCRAGPGQRGGARLQPAWPLQPQSEVRLARPALPGRGQAPPPPYRTGQLRLPGPAFPGRAGSRAAGPGACRKPQHGDGRGCLDRPPPLQPAPDPAAGPSAGIHIGLGRGGWGMVTPVPNWTAPGHLGGCTPYSLLPGGSSGPGPLSP